MEGPAPDGGVCPIHGFTDSRLNYSPPRNFQFRRGQKTSTIKGKNHHPQNLVSKDNIPENLFEVLPFHCEDLSKEEYRPYACVTYIAGPVHHQLSKACRKAGVNLVTMSGTKLKDILCSKNTTRHDLASKPGIYELQCPCSDKAKYIGKLHAL